MADTSIDFAAIESTEPVSTETSTEQGSGIPSSAESLAENQESQQQEPQLDGRRGPQNIRQSIKAASEALPDQAAHFKELGNAYFREQAYKQVFPTPAEATQAKQFIETMGGIEGYAQVQEKMAAYDAQDEGLRNGSPEVLDAFFKDFPEGAAALAPHYLERLAAASPDAYAAAVSPHAIALLEKAGIGSHLQALVNEPDPARREAMVKQLADWYQNQRQTVAQRPTQQKNPEADKISREREALNQEKEEVFTSQVRTHVNNQAGSEISKIVDQYAKQYRLTTEQKQDFLDSLNAKIVAQMNADQKYIQQVDLRKKSKDRDAQKLADFMVSEVKRILPTTAMNLAKVRYGTRGPAQTTGVVRPNAPTTAPNGAPLKVSQRPPDDQLDFSYPNADMDLIMGKGRLKGTNRYVTWR